MINKQICKVLTSVSLANPNPGVTICLVQACFFVTNPDKV